MNTKNESSVYAVALMEDGGEIREVRVVCVDLFGAPSLAEGIGAQVSECDSNGVPYAGRKPHFLPVQRLVAARTDDAGKRIIPAQELREKRAAFASRLASGPLPLAPRRKPRLSWTAEHERHQEEIAA